MNVMSTYFLGIIKKKTNFLFTPLMKLLAKSKVHPNVLTIFSFLTGIIAVLNIENRSIFILFGILTIFFDMLDGHLARYTKKVTRLGKHLDVISDRTIELLLILAAPVNPSLMLITALIFLLHHGLYYWVETAFFFRTLLIVAFALQQFTLGMYVALAVYVLSTLWQLRELIKKL